MCRRTLVLIALLLLTGAAHAEGAEDMLDLVDLAELSELSESADIDMKRLILEIASGNYTGGAEEIVRAAKTALAGVLGEAKNLFLAVLVPGVISGISGRLLSNRVPAIRLLALLAAAVPMGQAVLELSSASVEMAGVSSRIASCALPIAESLMALAGGGQSLSLLTPVAAVGAGVMTDGFGGIGVRLAKCAAAIAVAGNLGSYVRLDRLYRLVKKGTEWAVGLSLTLFLAVLSVNGMLGKNMDAAGFHAAKYAVDSFLPVVGGEMSDTLESVVTSMLTVKSAAGIGCMLLLIAVLIAPLLRLGAALFALRLASAVLEPVADGPVVSVADGVAGAVEMLLALGAASGALSILLIGQAMAAGSAVMG